MHSFLSMWKFLSVASVLWLKIYRIEKRCRIALIFKLRGVFPEMILFYYYFYYYHYKQFLYRISISIYYILLLIYVLLKKLRYVIDMNFKIKHGTPETNKSLHHCDLEWGFKIKHTVCRMPKNLTRMQAKLH